MMIQFIIFVISIFFFTACGEDKNKISQAASPETCEMEQLSSNAMEADSIETQSLLAEVPHSRFIVKLAPSASTTEMDENGMTSFASTVRMSQFFSENSSVEDLGEGYYLVKTDNALSLNSLQSELSDYESIEPDVIVHHTALPNDSELPKQWELQKIQTSEAWDISRGSRGVIVAVLDSGVDTSHPDLAANIWTNSKEVPNNNIDDDQNGYIDDIHGWNFVGKNNNVIADDTKSFHGTHVAGTIGAVGNNQIGISGHAQRVRIMPLKFLASDGSGFTSDAIKGINYAIKHRANIINNSWGSPQGSAALSDAIDRARDAGILFVAAAGNYGNNNETKNFYPANYTQDNVITVAASDRLDRLASFSNYGVNKVALAAPGVSIFSTKNNGQYHSLSGTSMATPLVSGVLATMIAARPDLSYQKIKSALLLSVDKMNGMRGKVRTGGRINSFRALKTVKNMSAKGPIEALPEDPGC